METCGRSSCQAGGPRYLIGREFWTETGSWRCTDVGTRTICAIKLGPIDIVSVDSEGIKSHRREENPRFLEGPPYAVVEDVFDEFEGLYPSEEALKKGDDVLDENKGGWNYRIVRTKKDENSWYEIHEVYYDPQGAIESWTQEPVLPGGETRAELMNDIAHFISAMRHPVLEGSVQDGHETLVPDISDQTINEGHLPELLDRIFVVISQFNDIILGHPVLRDHPQLQAQAHGIIERMATLYEETGKRMVE